MASIDDEFDFLSKLQQYFNAPNVEKRRLFIKYCLDPEKDQLYLLISNPETLIQLYDIDSLPINKEKLLLLKREYDLLHVEDSGIDQCPGSIWEKMYSIFIMPLLDFVPEEFTGYVFVLFDKSINASHESLFINIPYLYDLSFYYSDNAGISQLIFINVSDADPVRFLRKLFTAPLPTAAEIDILFGFPKEEDTLSGKFRQQAFQEGIEAAVLQGACNYTIGEIDLFETLFAKDRKGRVIQMLTHFHDGRIFNPNLTFITVDDLKDLLDRMFLEDRLRDDICIHAVTCNNFSSFKSLFQSGVKNIFYASNDLLTSEIAATFRELYHGNNAAKINLAFPYLDGRSFVFEAWTKVTRCFYRNHFLENNIDMYMTTKIILEGDLTNDFLKYLDKNKAKHKGIIYHPEFKDTNPEKAGFMHLLSLTIDLAKDVGIEVLAGLLIEFIREKMTALSSDPPKKAVASHKELRLKNKNIDLYAANYNAQELKEILNEILKQKVG